VERSTLPVEEVLRARAKPRRQEIQRNRLDVTTHSRPSCATSKVLPDALRLPEK
jgi:hypothetical protein